MGVDINIPFKLIDLVVVKREEWKALTPNPTEEYKEFPIYWVVNGFTETEECFSREECSRVLQQLQRKHMEEGLPDIRHNFMIGGDWTVYEGRGWKNISDLVGYENLQGISYDVSYIGPYPQVRQMNYPPVEMRHARDLILYRGICSGYVDSLYNHGYEKRQLITKSKVPLGAGITRD